MVVTDVIGDLHGCLDETLELLERLGYGKCAITGKWIHPSGRNKLVFCGDAIDRGPSSIGCLKLVMELSASGIAQMVRSNHDDKCRRYLRDYLAGNPIAVKVRGHFADTLEQLGHESLAFKQELYQFLDSLPYVYEDDNIVVVHAAYIEHGKEKTRKELALVGETDGSISEDGYPVRTYRWRDKLTTENIVIYGHDVKEEPDVYVRGNGKEVIGIDTHCCGGGYLTACRIYDDQTYEFIQVKARKSYYSR